MTRPATSVNGAAGMVGSPAGSNDSEVASATPGQNGVSGVLAVVLLDYRSKHQGWAWMRMVQGPAAFKDTPGLRFAKVMGSGHAGGFSLRPSATHQGLIAVFERQDQAEDFLASAYVAAARERAQETWSAVLTVDSARGQWDARDWRSTAASSLSAVASPATAAASMKSTALTAPGSTPPADIKPQPLAVITRASIRPAKAMAFWRYAPAAQSDLQKAPGCTLAMGLGEAPLVRQCTFSLWRDTPSMLAYAHGGAHQQAIEAAYRNSFFSESLFLRMRVLSQQGVWKTHVAP
jgi:hypothetical protein